MRRLRRVYALTNVSKEAKRWRTSCRMMLKEEKLLFPSIRENRYTQDVLHEITDEHEAAGDILKELRRITDDYSVPSDGCTTYSIAYDKLEEMENDLFMHIHLENNILFKGM